MKQWIAAIVLAMLLAGVGVFCEITISDMTKKLNELQLNYITLESNYNMLELNYAMLQSTYTTLESNYAAQEFDNPSWNDTETD